MCFVVFKFSAQQLLRKRNGVLSCQCDSHCLCAAGPGGRHCGFLAVLKAQPKRLGHVQPPWSCGCSALWSSAPGWEARGAGTPLHCLPLPLAGSSASTGMCLMSWMLCPGFGTTSGSRQKLRMLEKAALWCLRTPAWRFFIFPYLWMEKGPLWKDISALFIAHNNLITTLAAHWEQKAFSGTACPF